MDEYRAKEVLITGGLGFIGSNLAIRLVEAGASVTILDSLDPTCGANYFNIDPIRQDAAVIEGDSSDFALVRRLVRGNCLCRNAPGIRPSGEASTGRNAGSKTCRCKWCKQDGRRVVPHRLSPGVWNTGSVAASDQYIWATPACEARASGLRGVVYQASD